MTIRSTPPFRADHVGSLLRPPELLQARQRHASGEIDADALRAAEDEAILDAVRMQERVGLRSATDGEMRRDSWHMDFIYEIGGIKRAAERVEFGFNAENVAHTPDAAIIEAPLRLDEPIFGPDLQAVQSMVTTAVPKLTIPSPNMVHHRVFTQHRDQDIYTDVEEFWTDLTGAYAEEIQAIANLGGTYLQLDDVRFAMLNDPRQREMMRERGEDGDTLHLEYIRRFNAAVADRPSTLALTTHMCRGNFRSSWQAEGGYEYVAEALLNDLDVDGFFMEFDDERSGGFEPLRFLPPGKVVVLGLITSKRGELEDKDDIKRRIEEAARHADIDQLCLSPQCGFASDEIGNSLSHAEQEAKLELVVEVASEVWGEA